MSFGPLNLSLSSHRTETVNGQLMGGHHIGISWPKGPYFHFFGSNFYLSKDGVYQSIYRCWYDGYPGHFLWARFLALLEVILFFITLPFMLIAYSILMLVSFCAALCLTITLPCSFPVCCGSFMGQAIVGNRSACGIFWLVFVESILSIFYGLAYCITSPFQIIVPEFTQLLLKQHTWGTSPFAYF